MQTPTPVATDRYSTPSPCEHNWGLSTGSACKDCRQGGKWSYSPTRKGCYSLPDSIRERPLITTGPNSTWPTAAFHKARQQQAYQRYPCHFAQGVCGYEPIEREWAEQREWMHPLPSWVATRGWSGPQKTHGVFPSVDLSLANEMAWRRFVEVLEQRLLPLRSPSPPDRQGKHTLPLVVCLSVFVSIRVCSPLALFAHRHDPAEATDCQTPPMRTGRDCIQRPRVGVASWHPLVSVAPTIAIAMTGMYPLCPSMEAEIGPQKNTLWASSATSRTLNRTSIASRESGTTTAETSPSPEWSRHNHTPYTTRQQITLILTSQDSAHAQSTVVGLKIVSAFTSGVCTRVNTRCVWR